MKERWRYWKIEVPPEAGGDEFLYHRTKQRLVWRFFFRVIKKWFTPCDKCQDKINARWDTGVYIDVEFYREFIKNTAMKICSECAKKIQKMVSESEVILGNNDYEPPIELSRSWIDIEENNEPIIEAVSKEEFYSNHPFKSCM